MISYDDAKMIELLAPLTLIEPVPFRGTTRGAWGPLRRPVLAVAIVVVALALTGVAIANGIGAFDGIGAAQHPQTGADVIDSATRAYMEGGSSMPIVGGVIWDTARVVGRLPDGQNIYVFTTKSDNLCYVVGPPHPEWNCEDPLTRAHPSTVFAYTRNGEPWTIVGVTLDGVTSVSFDDGGREVTLPVKDNVWTYRTRAADDAFYHAGSSLTAHFADGTAVVQTYP